jgi:transposase-like protein
MLLGESTMTKNEQNRVVAWRLKIIRQASELPRGVAQTCRHFGLSRKTFYKWRARYKSHGDADLCDQPRAPLHFPRATPRNVVSKILYLRERYRFGPTRITRTAATAPVVAPTNVYSDLSGFL